MRIALVSHEYPPFGGGGIGTYATLMARCFADAGHEIHVITNQFNLNSTNPDHTKRETRTGNLWVHRVDAWTDQFEPAGTHASSSCPLGTLARDCSPYLFYSEKIAERLEQLHRKYNFDIVEFPECAAEGFSALHRKRSGLAFAGLPMVVCCHSPIDEIYKYNYYPKNNLGFWRRKSMEDDCIRWADGIHAPSALMLQIVTDRLGLPDDGTPKDVLRLPIDFTEIPEPTELAESSSPPTLFFVGRLEPRKGVRYLIDAAVNLMENGHPDLRVELVGRDCDAGEVPGMMSDFLKGRVPDRFKHNIIFHGYMQRDLLFARYRAATACVFAPEWDNFPYTCVEAMASGACIVGSHYSGVGEMVEHEQSGFVFQAGNVESLANTIRRAIEEPELNAQVRPRAISRIHALCNPDRAVQDRIAHYQSVIDSTRRHHREVCPVDAPAESIAVLVLAEEGAGDSNSLANTKKTIDSISVSADRANLEPKICIVSNRKEIAPADFANDNRITILHADKPNMSSARAIWLAKCDPLACDSLLCIRAGEWITPNTLQAWRRRLRVDPSVAWVSSRTLPARSEDAPSEIPQSPFSFTLPLGLIDPGPLPPALFRTKTLRSVGFWDTSLPEAWSDWSLRLAIHGAGFNGEILPLWLIRALPRTQSEPIGSNTRTVYLDRVIHRTPKIFHEHGSTLWLLDSFGEHHSFAPTC